jgi:hypothetical protein
MRIAHRITPVVFHVQNSTPRGEVAHITFVVPRPSPELDLPAYFILPPMKEEVRSRKEEVKIEN